jgi:ribosome production factor 2
MGNLFENKLLDMFEFEVTNFLPIEYFKGDTHIDACMKPVVIFQGDIFETDFEYARLKKFLFEYFAMYDIEDLSISVLKRLVVISAAGDKTVKIRTYELNDFNEYSVKDKLELKEIGPSLDLKPRRIKLAPEDEYKQACRQPKLTSKTKSKNETTNVLGEKRGRVYLTSQDLNQMSLKQYNRKNKKKNTRKQKENENENGNI